MSDASRLARLAYSQKPAGTPYINYKLSTDQLGSIESHRLDAAMDAAYAAAISYAESLYGLKIRSTSWPVIKFYYCSFYCIKSILLFSKVIPFNSGDEMLLEVDGSNFFKGGKSSHHWNWYSIRRTQAKDHWFSSQDSEEAYGKLRKFRENVNYTHGFNDPRLHASLISSESDLSKRFKFYRDDDNFQYTYLDDHLAFAYPTKLLFALDELVKTTGVKISEERRLHLNSLWKLRERCPLT